MNDLKYINYDIVFQEVPNEISLVFNISGWPPKKGGGVATQNIYGNTLVII
jgi:hypothetical protein